DAVITPAETLLQGLALAGVSGATAGSRTEAVCCGCVFQIRPDQDTELGQHPVPVQRCLSGAVAEHGCGSVHGDCRRARFVSVAGARAIRAFCRGGLVHPQCGCGLFVLLRLERSGPVPALLLGNLAGSAVGAEPRQMGVRHVAGERFWIAGSAV
ncbi:hypothetical protein, partial [Sideroxydans sp. CL21]